MANEEEVTGARVPDITDVTDVSKARPLEYVTPSATADQTATVQPPQPGRGVSDSEGKLTRAGMISVLENGGSVGLMRKVTQPDGRVVEAYQIIWRVQDLPDELELAGDNAEMQAAALKKLERQRAALDK